LNADIFEPHSDKQFELIQSDYGLTVAGTGTQWGKSQGGSLWFKRQMWRFTDRQDNFLMIAPTFKIMNQSMMPYFLGYLRGYGRQNKAESLFEMHDGRIVYFRTETDPDSIVGIPKVRAYWGDEAGKFSLYFWENIQARAAAVGALGLLTTSPYSRNWLYRQIIRPKHDSPNALPHIKLIQAASWENPYHTLHDPEKRRLLRLQMDPRRFDMLFGGEWGHMAGRVYDCFDEDANICEAFKLPPGTLFYGGIDWGHTEPFVIVIRAITPNKEHYQVAEFYKMGMTVPAQMLIARQLMQIWGVKRFYAGHERPENIELFCQNGIPTEGVPEKSIQPGTDLHYELIATRKYKVFKDTSVYSLDEYESYHYPEPEELGPDDDAEDQSPVGQHDHCMSANRFITLRTYKTNLKPFARSSDSAQETQRNRLARLMRPTRRKGTKTENWS
jgi:hypothetical protein